MRSYRALKVVWAVPMLSVPYEGLERVYVLTGLSFGHTRIITGYIEVPNVSPFPVDTFTVLQKDVREVTDSLTPPNVVLGYAHTHPDNFPNPSINDIQGIARGMLGLVISSDNTHCWYVRNRTISPTVRHSLVA
jgi:proteasome lid subunit RPN8/RPN11